MNKYTKDLAWFSDKFDRKNGVYLSLKNDASVILHHQLAIKLLKRNIKSLKGKSFLDVGCACGDFTNDVHTLFEPIFSLGVDFSPDGISVSQKRYPGIEFEVHCLPRLELNGKYDLICLMDVLYYLSKDDVKQSLENVDRILTGEGSVLVSISIVGRNNSISSDDFEELISPYFKITDRIDEHALFQRFFAKALKILIRLCDKSRLSYFSKVFLYVKSITWIPKINYILCRLVMPKKGVTKKIYLLNRL